jgi:hypothetical protein
MSDIQSIIAKVQKLLALSENNPSENEASAARAMADRILQEHRITQAQLEAAGEVKSEPFCRKSLHQGGRRVAWKEVILCELCVHYGGAMYYNSHREGGCGGRGGGVGGKGVASYVVLARESDLAVIEYMFTHLTNETDRLARWHTGGEGIRTAVAWRMGCAMGIASQFRDLQVDMRAAASGEQSCAIVLLDKRASDATAELERLVKLSKGKTVYGGTDSAAMSKGYAEGRKVQIKQALGDGTAHKLT